MTEDADEADVYPYPFDFQFTCAGEVITVGDGSNYTDDDEKVSFLIGCYMALHHPELS